MQKNRDFTKGFIYSLISVTLVSTNFVTAKYALRAFNPETFSFIWTSSAAFYSYLIVRASGISIRLKSNTKIHKYILILGVMTGAGMLFGWAGLARLDPSFAAFLWRFSPVLTIILSSLLLRESFSLIEIIPVAIMVSGGVVSTLGRWSIVGIGIVLTLCSCLFASIQMLTAKILIADLHPKVIVFYRVFIGAIIITLWTFLVAKADFNVGLSYWAVTLIGAFLGPCASHIFFFHALRHWELSRTSMVLTLQPLFVLPLAYIFFARFPVKIELIGGFLILIGGCWLAWIHLRKTAHE